MLKFIKIAVTLFLVVFLAIHAHFYLNQRQLMYLPSTERVHPQDVGLSDVDEVSLNTQSNKTLVSWHGRATSGMPTILFFHGNGGAVGHRTHRFRGLMAEGLGVFVLGYPGYGGNDGTPSEAAFLEGASLSYEYLLSQGLAADDIVIYGESIGTGVAVQLAAQVDAKALILQAPFSRAARVARVHYPYLLADLFLKDTYKSIDHIEYIDMPLLIVHGDLDQVIPIEIGRKLFESAREPKTFVTIPGAKHNDLHLYSIDSIAHDFIQSIQ
jgi:fermentation-respiration switch protein FrsA (DUF1100 family)